MRPNTIVGGFLLAALFTTVAWGQALRPSAEVLEPFVNDQTVLVAHGDLSKVKPADIETFVWSIAEKTVDDADKAKAKDEVHSGFAKFQERLEQFIKAGGRDVYIVQDWARNQPGEPRILIPFYGDDAGDLLDCFDTWFPNDLTAEVVGKTVVAKPAHQRQGAAQTKPSARPDVQEALKSIGDAPVGLAIIPPDSSRKWFGQTVPTLPPFFGGGPGTQVTQGLKWAVISGQLPPNISAKLIIQSQDAASAQAFRGVIEKGLDFWANMAKSQAGMDDAANLIKPLLPAQEGDRLTLSVGQQQVDAFVAGITPAMRSARQNAVHVQSSSNMRQLLIGCIMYANDHKGQWPPTLDAAIAQLHSAQQLLINPANPTAKPGYIYVKPANPQNPQALVLYEAYDKWPGQINVGYADGHVEATRDQARFNELLKAAGK